MEDFAGIAGCDDVLRNIAHHNRARADNGARTDGYTRHHKCTRTYERVLANCNLCDYQRNFRPLEIMSSRAEISFLRDRCARPDFDLAQAIGIRPVAQAGAIVQRKIPGNGNARALMNEWRAVDLRIEHPQPKKPPFIQRDRKSTRLNSSHVSESRMPSSA